MTENKNGVTNIRIHPSVIQQLGESLITDEIQALVELAKNSYDADATYVKIQIKTPTEEQLADKDNKFFGEVTIEDNGSGMNAKEIIGGWLHVSSRRKLKQKSVKKLTKEGRSPLGDKGLGRLGVQKIGNVLEMTTKSKNNSAYSLQIDWQDFYNAKKLDKVPIKINKLNDYSKVGTILKITNLLDKNIWNGKMAQERLRLEFSKMISPYKKIRKFVVFLEINGKKIELTTIADELRNFAQIQYSLTYDESKLFVNAKISNRWFVSKCNLEKKTFSTQAHFDDFAKQVLSTPFAKQYNIKVDDSNEGDWLFKYQFEIELLDIDNIEYVEGDLFNQREIADPGPFESEIDYFDFADTSDIFNVFSKRDDYRMSVKGLDGIRVFRDGFGVRTGEDWLKLGSGSTSKTFYSLRLENTNGYISISAENNSKLEETTAREKFKDTPYYRNFFNLLQTFRDFTDRTNNFFGRQWVAYRNNYSEKIATNNLDDTSNIKEAIQTKTKNIKTQQNILQSFKEELKSTTESSISTMEKFMKKVESEETFSKSDKDDLELTIKNLKNVIKHAESLIPKLDEQLSELNKLDQFAEVINERFEKVNVQLSDIFETASLGLVAESLSHEIHNITDQLLLRSKEIKKHISPNDIPLNTYNEYIISTAFGLKKQISYIDPALKNVRDKKDIFNLSDFFSEFIEYQNNRLGNSKILIELENHSNNEMIKFNKGKLIQIFDNLINNSEYWLQKENINNKTIFIRIENDYSILLWDNGPGIDHSVENILFEPFISAKYNAVTKTRGRGLGLFIINQLLQYDNCSIELLSEKNQLERYYKFRINLLGAKDV